jgi:hypothetical protein
MSTLLYNPDRKNKQQFIEEFVVRTEIFDQIFSDIKSGKMKHPEQHYLLVGQRGTGKTTLIMRLKYAIEDDKKLSEWLIPVVFSEEQYNITELANVWENIAVHLEDYYGFEGITREMEKQTSHTDFESLSFEILLSHLRKSGKKIVLFVDNIGDLLKKFGELEVRRLREILQTVPDIRLIAGSSVVLDSILDYQQPLFEFFKVIQLKGLTYEESVTLLQKLAALHKEEAKIERIIKESPSRIETLRTLSGGVPRTIALLFQVFVDSEHGNALTDLEKILDAVTPLYKHRMDDLPAQQQKIVNAVALNWDAVSVKELTEGLRMESKVISAQLRQLEKNQVIEKRVTDTKNHLYLLRERFFNIWYLMRYGRKQDRQRVIWLVKFLEMWCDRDEIEKRILNYAEKVRNGQMDQYTFEIYGEVYSFFGQVRPETKLLLKHSAPEYLSKEITITEEEFTVLMKKYFEERNWDKFITVGVSSEEFSDDQKKLVYKLFSEIDSRDFRDEMLDKIKLSEGRVPYFYLACFFQSSFLIVVSLLEGEKEVEKDNIKKGVEFFGVLYERMKDFGYITKFEESIVISFFLILSIHGYHNFALQTFNKLFGKEMGQEKYKIFYYYLNFASENKDLKILEKLAPEVRDKVLSIEAEVRNFKKIPKP